MRSKSGVFFELLKDNITVTLMRKIGRYVTLAVFDEPPNSGPTDYPDVSAEHARSKAFGQMLAATALLALVNPCG